MKVHVWEEAGSKWHYRIVSADGKELSAQSGFESEYWAWFEAGSASFFIFNKYGVPAEGIIKKGKP